MYFFENASLEQIIDETGFVSQNDSPIDVSRQDDSQYSLQEYSPNKQWPSIGRGVIPLCLFAS
jgi:hypothetical protein